MKIMRASITMHYNREMEDEEDEELSRIVHVRSLSGSPPWTSYIITSPSFSIGEQLLI